MARKEIPATIEITDDVTGKPVTDAESVKVSLDGKTYALDMSAETRTAFRAFLAEPTDDTRRAFGALIPRPRVRTGSSNGTGGTVKVSEKDVTPVWRVPRDDYTVWATENGFPVNERAAQPVAARAKYREMHAASA